MVQYKGPANRLAASYARKILDVLKNGVGMKIPVCSQGIAIIPNTIL
jgi:hypothetical protein